MMSSMPLKKAREGCFPAMRNLTEKKPWFSRPAALYLAVSFGAFFPSLVMGHFYFDDDLLIYSGILHQFLRNALAQGHLPLWNPYIFAGQPLFADPTSMMTYPLWYLTLLFPTAYGFGLFSFAHLFLAALGMHFWLKNLGLSEESCRAGSLSFSLSGFFWFEIIHLPCLAALAWTPWVLGWIEKFARDSKPSSAFFAGLTFALLFLVGFFQMTLGVLYLGIAYFLFRRFTRDRSKDTESFKFSGRQNWGEILLPAICFMWASLPLFALWVPASEFMGFSDRLSGKLPYETFNAGYSLDPQKIFQFLFPRYPLHDDLGNYPLNYGDYLSNAGYLGIWMPFLVLFAFKRDKKPALFLGTAALLTLLVCFGKYTPVHQFICRWIPGFSLLRSPFRFLHLYVTCASVLIAFGFETLSRGGKMGPKHSRAVILTGGVWTATVLAAALMGLSQARNQAGFLVLGELGLFGWFKTKNGNRWGKWIFLSSILFSLLISGWSSSTSRLGPASNFDFHKEASLITRIKEKAGNSRVFMGDNIPYSIEAGRRISQIEFPANASCLFGLRNAGGYGPLSLMKRGQLHTLPFNTFIRLMAVQGFATGNEKGEVAGFTRNPWGPVRYYQAKEVLPFVYAPDRIGVISDDEDRLTAMRESGFNPYEQVYLDINPSGDILNPSPGEKASVHYDLLQDGLDEQVFKVDLDAASWIVFSEVNYPGWKAWVDQIPARIYTANHLFRGLMVPAGPHLVIFRFVPAWFRLVGFGLVVWIIFTVVFWWLVQKPK